MHSEVTVRVPAKVNVYLGVGPRSLDGYHELATVFQAVSIYDEITVRPAETLSISVIGAAGVPTDSQNLVWQAAELVAGRIGRAPDVHIEIVKRIPIAAGMAGGSADAAATLLALDILWNAELGREELDLVAAALGADVPFMLHGGCALGSGRGDLLSPVLTRGSFHWVFATFADGLSTPEIYRLTDEMRGPDFSQLPSVPTEVLAALAAGDPVALGPLLHNDLQAAAIRARSDLGRVLETGLDLGALGAIVSGSGPTCAFLVADEARALDLLVGLSSSGLVNSVVRAHGPVHGARLAAS